MADAGNYIIPGTTPTISYVCDVDISGCTSALLTFKRGSKILIEKERADLTFSQDGKTVSFVPTQAETLRLLDNDKVDVQLRVVLGGVSMATAPFQFNTGEALHRREI